NGVGPRSRLATSRRAAPARRVRVDPRRDVAHGSVAVERVMRAWIDLDRDGMAGLPRTGGEPPARFRRRPVINFTDQDRERVVAQLRRPDWAHTVGVATRREAVGHDDDVASP